MLNLDLVGEYFKILSICSVWLIKIWKIGALGKAHCHGRMSAGTSARGYGRSKSLLVALQRALPVLILACWWKGRKCYLFWYCVCGGVLTCERV